MNSPDEGHHGREPDWLGRALQRALPAPAPSPGFHARLLAAVQRGGETRPLASRQALAVEYERQVVELRRGYVRLQWRTLGTLLGVAFVCGIGLTLAAPSIRAQFGDWGLLGMAGAGTLAGIVIGARSWLWNGA